MPKLVFCPHCGERLRPGAMDPIEFKTVRMRLGLRVGLPRPISRWAFSQMLGVAQSTIQSYEKGDTPVPPEIKRKVRRILATPPNKLCIPGKRRKVTPRANRKVGYGSPPDAPMPGEPIKKRRQSRKRMTSLERKLRRVYKGGRRPRRPPKELREEWEQIPVPDEPPHWVRRDPAVP